jgi:galactose oxidase
MARFNYFLLSFSLSLFKSALSASISLNRNGWTATADSQHAGNEASKAIDGDANTFWHSEYTPNDPLPNTITIDMKSSYLVNGVSIQPRQDGSGNGRIGQHKIELSADNSAWTQVAIGAYVNDATTKKTSFLSRPARYVKITALTEAQGANNPWTSAAEINVFADFKYTSRTGWVVSADSEETAAAGNQASNGNDGQAGTIWHTQYTPTVANLPHWFRIDQGAQVTVAGLSYLPRADGANGRIGQYAVQASNDSSAWTQVAAGTWADDGNEKTASFNARARYFRLNALTEAGGRGQWSSAAEFNLIDPTPPTYTAPSATKGLWVNTVDFPIVPAAAAVLPNGKILLWSAYKLDDFGGGTGFTQTAIYDPATGASTQRTISNTQHDMFCPGISMDFNGRIIVTGGNNAEKTSIYDPGSDAWVAGANMQIPRGYQSTATTSNGKVFNIGGSWSGGNGGKNGEIYDPSGNGWSLIQNALVSPMLTQDRAGVYRSDNHAWLFGWKNATVFQAGPSKAMNWYNTAGAGSTTGAGNRGNDGDAMNGNAVMYDAVAGKILTAGGAANYQTDQARTNAYVITINAPNTNPTVAQTASMSSARGFANGVVLPDGTVFVTGGQSTVEPFTDTTAALTPELWNPATNAWTQMSPMAIPRTYHSIALLLPDATVLNGGGGLCGGCATNHWDAEIFVPPYLLNSDGTRKTRPEISTVASTVKIGATLSVTTNSAVNRFSLVRFGTTTHTVNTDQRRINLTPSGSGTSYTVTVPNDPGVALPGYWYLFAINSAGTPSVAKVIKVTL